MKWYNVELNKSDAEVLRRFLKENDIKYEASAAYNLIHFEIYESEEDVYKIEDLLDTL